MRRWLVNGGILLALLWMLYVFLHVSQVRVWRQLHTPHLLSFRYALLHAQSSVTPGRPAAPTKAPTPLRPSGRFKSLNDLPSVRFDPLPTTAKPCSPKDLGPIKTPFTRSELKGHITERVLPVLGGLWRPKDCAPQHRVAVIIPYRNRSDNLAMSTTHLNFFLQQQLQEYGVFVIEQADAKRFNRAKLLNIGFLFISRRYPQFNCFVFHDADKLPLDTRNIYKCDTTRPRHMITKMRTTKSPKFNKGMLYSFFFGGVTALTKQQFQRANGMSNGYWGWGREDDDLCARLQIRGMSPLYNHNPAGTYVNIAHQSDVIPNSNPWPHSHMVRKAMDKDGLNSVNFTIKSHERQAFYTLLSVYL